MLKDRVTYYPEEFYDVVEKGLHDTLLEQRLFALLSSYHRPVAGAHDQLLSHCASGCYQHQSLGYTAARRILFGELHLEKSGSVYAVRDVYCQHLSTAAEYTQYPPGPDQIPDPAVLNAEHTWPQSHFNKNMDKDLQKSDLHILYPAMAKANTSRSNHAFNEVVTTLSTPCALSRRGYAADGSREIFFEPPERHKGNVARAIFYFAIRYQLPVTMAEEASLKAWHRMDPPDEFERQRNEIIFSKQKVRNPFIDHPELVDLISDF